MNNDFIYGKKIKDRLAKGVLPTLLAGSMLFSSGTMNEAEAYSLEGPTQGYEDYLEYEGIKVFINGRYVEFNESTGYPFVLDGSTMIPLRAVSEAFGAKVEWNSKSGKASVSKFDKSVDVKVNSNEMIVKDYNANIEEISLVTKEALVKDGRTYIPLRSLFENFGLSVRWEEETKTAHIETIRDNDLPNIDFKDEKVLSIKDIDINKYETFIYDGEEIEKEYINVLKNSDQYKVIINDGKVQIFSYQFLYNLNQIYEINVNLLKSMDDDSKPVFYLRNATLEEMEFLTNVFYFTTSNYKISYSRTNKEDLRKDYEIQANNRRNEYKEMLGVAKEIVSRVKSSETSIREQVSLAVDLLNEHVDYNKGSGYFRNDAYGALVNQDSQCTGYAFAFNLIMQELGVPCIYFAGPVDNKRNGHSWNYVYVDGEWSICDATNKRAFYPLDTEYYDALGNNYHYDVEILKLTYDFSN